MTASPGTAMLRTLLAVGLLAGGLALATSAVPPAQAHEQTELVAASGTGRCPSGIQNCSESWTHVNSWTHYTARVPANCAVEIIDQCGITVTSRAASSSCRNSSNCGHGPHSSTPRPTGPGTWTTWNGHSNTNYRWSGQRREPVDHDHGSSSPSPTPSPSDPEPSPSPTPSPSDPNPAPPFFDPSDIDWSNFDPCANGGCLPPCMTDGVPGSCPWDYPPPKVCTTAWGKVQREALLSRLRWESIVPYSSGFTAHHPEVPGGHLYLTAASSPNSPTRHWTAIQPGTTLDVQDAPVDGCLWTANAVGVSLRELIPHEAADLTRLRTASAVAAADEAHQAAELWDRLSSERRQWFQAAFPRNDPPIVWCSPADLPPWTMPASDVLSLPSDWDDRFGKCRWTIPRRGFWEWKLQVKYTSEQGDLHTEVVASDLSWFREPTGYVDQQVTLW